MSTKPIKMEEEENITHEEIWDDSALIDSWNQALDEYKVWDGNSFKVDGKLMKCRNTTAFMRKAGASRILKKL